MNRLVLLCVETTRKAGTDYAYIKSTIDRFYIDTRKITYRPIYLESKTKYKDKSIIKKINDQKKGFKGQIDIIYCIDMDDYNINHDTKMQTDEIKKYCDENNIHFVFFCKDVEDVYLGCTISDNMKVKESEKFKRLNLISKVKEENLCKKSYCQHSSNILTVLDKIWTRKE